MRAFATFFFGVLSAAVAAQGCFEGGGCSAKGIYRPEYDCRMKNNNKKGFCSVCSEAVEKMIEFYIK